VFFVVRFQVLTAASLKITAFCDIEPCSVVEVDRRFRGVYCLHQDHYLMMEEVCISETSIFLTILHCAIFQKTVILYSVLFKLFESLSKCTILFIIYTDYISRIIRYISNEGHNF
jgi:hypothetical protein